MQLTVFRLESNFDIGGMAVTSTGEEYFTIFPSFRENHSNDPHEYRLCRRVPSASPDMTLELECVLATDEEILKIEPFGVHIFMILRRGTTYTLARYYTQRDGRNVALSTIPGPVHSILVLDADTVCVWGDSRQFLSVDGGSTWTDVKNYPGRTFVTRHGDDLYFLRESMLTTISKASIDKGTPEETVLWQQPKLRLGWPIIDRSGNVHCVTMTHGYASLFSISGTHFTIDKLPIDMKMDGTLKLLFHDEDNDVFYFKLTDGLIGHTNLVKWSASDNSTLYGPGFNASLQFLCAANGRLYFREITEQESTLIVLPIEW